MRITTHLRNEIRRLHSAGLFSHQIAAQLGISVASAWKYRTEINERVERDRKRREYLSRTPEQIERHREKARLNAAKRRKEAKLKTGKAHDWR